MQTQVSDTPDPSCIIFHNERRSQGKNRRQAAWQAFRSDEG